MTATAALAAVVLLVTGLPGSGGSAAVSPDRGPAAAPAVSSTRAVGPSPPAEPAPLCQVQVAGKVSPLTGERAKALTAAAAHAAREERGGSDLASVVQRIQDRNLPESAVEAAYGQPTLRPGPSAVALAAVLRGAAPAALTCRYPRPAAKPEPMGPSGLTARAARLRGAIQDAYGRQIMGGFAPGGITSGHADDSAHYEGRALDVFHRPLGERNTARGWSMAQWLVAHADSHSVLSVIWQDRIWTVWASGAGWRDYVPPSGPTRNVVLRHLDHIHTAVVSGRPRKS